MPQRDAAILEAAVVLAEYIEKLCSVNKEKNILITKILVLKMD